MPDSPSDDHMPGRFQRLVGAPLAALFIAGPVLAGILAVDAGGVRTAIADAVRPGDAGDDDDDVLDIGLDTNGDDSTGTATGDNAFTDSPAQPADQLGSPLTGDSPEPALEPQIDQLDGSPDTDDSPPPPQPPAPAQVDDSPDSPPSPEPPAPAQDQLDDSPDSPDDSPDS